MNLLNIKKSILLSVILLTILQPLYGAQETYRLSVGAMTMDKRYESSTWIHAQKEWLTRSGWGLQAGLGFHQSDSNNSDSRIKRGLIESSFVYHLNPTEPLSSFFGAGVTMTFISDTYDSPALGYVLKTGLLYKWKPSVHVVGTLTRHFLTSGQPHAILNGTSFSFGLQIPVKYRNWHTKKDRQKKKTLQRPKRKVRQHRF